MRIINVVNYDDLSQKAAQIVISQIILKPDSVLGLATGSTPEKMYALLAKYEKEGLGSFADISTFNLDEYYGIVENSPQSYSAYMHNHLFSKVSMNHENIHLIPSKCDDIQRACSDYDDAIKEAGGIDLQVLGIGRNGHIGFNEPDIKFEAKTHLVHLDDSTIEANARFFDNESEVPTSAISMGIKNIMQSKKILLLASGYEKAEAVYQMIHGPITPNLPASVLQLHPDVIVIVDQGAASKLKGGWS